jgi:hypothetical protein
VKMHPQNPPSTNKDSRNSLEIYTPRQLLLK